MSIDLYMEIPQAHLNELGSLVDGHFCIASRCLSHPEYYAWYRNRPRDVKVMLDNGTHEDRKPLSGASLLEVGLALKPDLIFAPDILLDRQQTYELSVGFFHAARQAGYTLPIGFVPQGKDNDDLVASYQELATFLLEHHPGGVIGLSLMDNREHFLESIPELLPVRHHMLGLRNLQEIPSWPFEILSMDTVKPIKAAYHGLLLEDCPRGLGVWDTGWVLTEDQLTMSKRNINVLKEHLGGLYV